MFFSGRGDTSQAVGYGPWGEEVRDIHDEDDISVFPSTKSLGQWIVVVVPNLFSLVSLLLNTLCFVVMVIKSQCTFTSALNLLVMAFLLSMAYYSLNNMVCSILGEILFVQGKTILEINQLGDLFSSYFSVTLLFLIGLNRDAVYTSPTLMKTLFKRKNMVILLPFLAIICLAVSFLIYKIGGMSRRMESDGLYTDYATDVTLITVCSYIAYGIALSSGVFYIRVFFHLRQQRVGVTHDKTKELLDKAERQNCAQASFIMGMYLVSLVAFIICDNIQVEESRQMILHSFQAVVKTIPALGIPTAMLLYCDKMQGMLKYLLFDRRKGKKCRPSSTSTSSMVTRRTTLSVVSML